MKSLLFAVLFALLIRPASAQSAPVCPPPVLLSLARAGSACYGMGVGDACYGGGIVSTTQYDAASGLALPGDRATVGTLERIVLAAADEGISTVIINLQADLPDAEQKRVTLLAFGGAEINNRVPPVPRQIVTALGTLNVRAAPSLQTEIVARLNINQTLTANGITADGRWLRVAVPNSDALGWVAVDVVRSDGAVQALAVVTPETPLLRPFEHLTLATDDEYALCDGALPAGVLLQSPNVAQPATLTLNETRFQLAGTVLVQGDTDALRFHVLEGEAVIDGLYVPAGAALDAGSVLLPFDAATTAGLPYTILPRRVQPVTITAEDIFTLTTAYESRVEAVPLDVTLAPDTTCRRLTTGAVTLWAGPGNFYEAINELPAGRPVAPVLAYTVEGDVWWQLANSNWVRARLVRETGDCAPVPATDRFTPPLSNRLSLETCQTTNGPLREGQSVRIEFRPPPFDNYGEARDAVMIAPGRFVIGAKRYLASATDPIKLGTADDRYIRTFYVDWRAVPGTFRIEGDRLSYTPICTITVPVG